MYFESPTRSGYSLLILAACTLGLSSATPAGSVAPVRDTGETPASDDLRGPGELDHPLSGWHLDRAPGAAADTPLTVVPPAAPVSGPLGEELGFPLFPLPCGSSIPWPSVATGDGYTVAVSNNCIAFLDGDEITHSGAMARESGAFFDVPPPLPATPGIPFGVQTVFDPHSQRFIIAGGHEPPFHRYMAVAMSHTSDPNEGWYKHVFIPIDEAPGSPSLAVVGVDAEYVYVSVDVLFANDPNDPFSRTLIYIFDKDDLAQDLDNEPPPRIVIDPFPELPVRPFPVLNHDADAPAQYFVTPFGTPIGTSRLRLFAITGLPDQPTVDTIELDTPPHVLNGAQQMPTPGDFTIRAESSRIRSAAYRDGSLWTAMHLHPEDVGRRTVRWYEIATRGWPLSGETPELIQHGDIDPGDGVHTHEPAIAINAEGRTTVVFAQTSTSQWPSIATAWREAGDPPGTTRAGGILGETEPFDSLFNSQSWGGQSSVANDPSDPRRFLSTALVRGLFGNQGNATTTWLARFRLPELAPTLTIDPPSLDFGDVVVNTTGAPRTAMLHNTGGAAATGLTFDGSGGVFEVDAGDCGVMLEAGESCELTATFTPTALGPADAVLMVASTEGAGAQLSLAGSGVLETEIFAAVALEVDPSVVSSDGNGILEPGELVAVAPTWRNEGINAQGLTGTVSGFTGPEGAIYTVLTEGADYGGVEPGELGSCLDTGDCYVVSVSNPSVRPATSWTATLDEALSDGSGWSWNLHIGDSFTDVPRESPFYRPIETLLHHGVTGGCTGAEYCPGGVNSRGQMAVFLLKAAEGEDYQPPACGEEDERFGDVPFDHPFCSWIEELAGRDVTSGCGDGNYCPGDAVTRAQMAVFLLKAVEGGDYQPPACNDELSDVPCPSTFAAWIEELAARGITGGCAAEPPAYCPADAVTRAQMATFVTRAFALALYGP